MMENDLGTSLREARIEPLGWRPRPRFWRSLVIIVVCLAALSCQEGDNGNGGDHGDAENGGLPTSGSEPGFEPAKWDELIHPEGWSEWSRERRRKWLVSTEEGTQYYRSFRLRIRNNCYNYACNRRNEPDPTGRMGPPAEPGRGGGYTPPNGWSARGPGCTEVSVAATDPGRSLRTKDVTCAVITAAARADGLREHDCEDPCPRGTYKKALVVDPLTHDERVDGECDIEQTDYHWLRQDKGGKWSHKPGESLPTDDAPGDPTGAGAGDDITDPREPMARRNYTEFCGCFCCGPTVTKAGFSPLIEPSRLLFAFAALGESEPPLRPGVQLVRLVFSGRANPRVTLSVPAEHQEIARRLQGLPEVSKPEWPILGERGFALYTEHQELIAEHGFALVVVHDGVIEIGTKYYRDLHELEAWSKARWAVATSAGP